MGKFNDIMPKAQPDNFVEQKSKNKKNKFQRKPRKDGAARDARGFSMPQVPVQNMVDVVKEQNRGRNQVLDRTSRRPSERTMYGDRIGEEEVRNPFKNGYFKPTRDQSASKNVNLAQASEDVKNLQKSQAAGTDERTNAQKLFNSISGNEVKRDAKGNAVAYKNGQAVGFGGIPDKTGKVMGIDGRVHDPRISRKEPVSNTEGNFTEREREQNRMNIQAVANNFERGDFELPKIQPTQPDPSRGYPTTPQGLPDDTPGNAANIARQQGLMKNLQPTPPVAAPVSLPIEQSKPADVGMFPHASGQFNPMDVPGLFPKISSALSQGTNQIKDWIAEYLMGQQPTNLDTYFQNQLPKVQEARKQFNMPALQ